MPTEAFSPAKTEHYFGIGVQSVKGTGVAPTTFAAFMEAVDLAHNHQNRRVREAGNGPIPARTVRDTVLPTFQFGGAVRPEFFGKMMAYFLGAAAVSGASDPFTHTLTPDMSTDWLSIERNVNDEEIERLVDAFFIEAELDIRKRDSGPEPILTIQGGALSADRQASPTAESYEANRAFLRSDCAWTIDGNTVTNVESARVRMRWTFDERIIADSLTRSDAIKIAFEADIEVVQLFATAQDAIDYRETHYYSGAADGSGTAYAETVYGSTASGFIVDMNYTDRQARLSIAGVDWDDARVTEPNPAATEAVRMTRTGALKAPAAGDYIEAVAQTADSAAYLT